MTDIQNNLLFSRIQSMLADAIQVPVELVTSELRFGDLPQWDSLGHMEIMIRMEEQFGVEVNADTIARLISIPEIIQYIQSNGNQSIGNPTD